MKNTKVDLSKLRRVATEEIEGYKPMFPKPKKKLKKNRSKLQIKKDNPNSTYYKKKALSAWGKLGHMRFKHCAICGAHENSKKLDFHHLVGKSRILTRNDPDNGIMLCITHHLYDTEISAHMAPLGFIEWLKENMPEKIDYIRENQHRTGKTNYKQDFEDLTEMIKYGNILKRR